MARQIKVEILADARRLNQAFDSVDKRVRTFGGGLKSMAGVVAGSFAALGVGKFVADSVKGFQEHQKVTAMTSVRLKSMGDIANVSAGHVGRLADALERKTTVDGDVIQSGENLLLTFGNIRNEVGKGNQIFDRGQPGDRVGQAGRHLPSGPGRHRRGAAAGVRQAGQLAGQQNARRARRR
jgi:hypothetical protein